MNENQITEFITGVDANVIFMVQAFQKTMAEIATIKKYSIVSAKNGTIWEISGYVYGRTSNDDPYILLYPAHPKMKHKVTRAYPHQFGDLPHYIPTNNIPENAPDGNPTKDQAIKKGIYHECDQFTIATIDGKDTNMGPEQRFFMTLEVPEEESQPPIIIDSPSPSTKKNGSPTPQIIQNEVVVTMSDESKLNSLLGLGKPESPYKYDDGTELANSNKLEAIYLAHWDKTQAIPKNGEALQSWYKSNKELFNEPA